MGGHLFKDRSRADFSFIKTTLLASFNVRPHVTFAFVWTSTSTSTLNILDAGTQLSLIYTYRFILKKMSVIVSVRNSRCGKVMFSQACVKNSVHGGEGHV